MTVRARDPWTCTTTRSARGTIAFMPRSVSTRIRAAVGLWATGASTVSGRLIPPAAWPSETSFASFSAIDLVTARYGSSSSFACSFGFASTSGSATTTGGDAGSRPDASRSSSSPSAEEILDSKVTSPAGARVWSTSAGVIVFGSAKASAIR